MNLLEPVTIENKAIKEEIVNIILEESKAFIDILLEGKKPENASEDSKKRLKFLVSKSLHTGIEYALWKFAASLDKSRSIPEPDIFLKALKRVAKNG